MKEIKTEILIKAPREKVWEVLMDFLKYPDWNPFIRNIKGNPELGNTIEVKIEPEGNKPMIFKPVVLANIENREFKWKGKLFVKGVFDGEHYFLLEEVSKGETKFTHGEIFTGFLSGFVMKKIGDSTNQGFEEMNKALKKRAEE